MRLTNISVICISCTLFLYGGYATVDLIHKVKDSAEFLEGIITTSIPCCSLNTTLLKDYSAKSESDLTAANVGLDMFPFIWTVNAAHEADFVQIDLRYFHSLTNLIYRVVEEHPFDCAYSMDGITWDLDLECTEKTTYSSGSEKSFRYVRLFPEEPVENKTIRVSVALFGQEMADDHYERRSFHNVACHGYQARLDIEMMDDGFLQNCDKSADGLTLTVEKDGTDYRDELDQHFSMYVEVTKVQEYHKCVVSLVIEGFQSHYSAKYTLGVSLEHDSATTAANAHETVEFEVGDDGNADDSFFYIATSVGNYFISVANYSFESQSPSGGSPVLIGNMATLEEACATKDNAAVLTWDRFERVQAGGLNHLIQPVVYQYLDTFYGDERAESGNDTMFMAVKDGTQKQCMYAHKVEIEATICDGTSDPAVMVLCMHTEGEISNINITSSSCAVSDSSGSSCVDLEYEVTVAIMGSRTERNVTCWAKDFQNNEISGTRKVFTIRSESARFSVSICPDFSVLVSSIFCEAPALVVNDDVGDPRIVNADFVLPLFVNTDQLVDIAPNVTSINDADYNETFFYYLDESDYGKQYAIEVSTSGYPVGDFTVAYQQMFAAFEDATTAETEKVLGCEGNNPIIRATGRKTFAQIDPSHTGLYRFSITTLASDYVATRDVEIIHPYSIKCENSCSKTTQIGNNFVIHCDVSHHLITSSELFSVAETAPLQIKLIKTELPADLPGSPELNPCEYSIPLATPILLPDATLDVNERKIGLDIEIFSLQEWNRGEYQIVVEVDDSKCIYQQGSTMCSEDPAAEICSSPPKLSTTSARGLRFLAQAEEILGEIASVVDSCNPNNPRALFFVTTPPPEDHEKFYYKVCFYDVDLDPPVHPVDLCGQDGGQYVEMTSDLQGHFVDSFFDSPSFSYYGLDMRKVWGALTCNYYFRHPAQPQAGTSMTDLHFYISKNGDRSVATVPVVFNGYDWRRESSQFSGDVLPGVFCRYWRGQIWNMYTDASDCLYTPLNVDEGQRLNVNVLSHGNDLVSVKCKAFPDSSFPEIVFNDINPGESFTCTVPFPNEIEVDGFRCAQIFNGDVPAAANWFQLKLNSRYLPLKIDDNITTEGLWCDLYNVSLEQPCIGKDVTIKSCVEGNPIRNCDWKLFSLDTKKEVVLQQSDKYSWDDVRFETPQCNNTRRCSVFTLKNLQFSDEGWYWFECYSGVENSELLNQRFRSTSKTVKITAQQSASMGENKFIFTIDCDEKIMRGRYRSYGQNVTTEIKCQASESDEWIPQVVIYEYPGKGAVDLIFYPESPTRTTICMYKGSNEYASRPLIFNHKLEDLKIANELVATLDSENDRRVCCEACAFDIQRPDFLQLRCTLANGLSLEFEPETLESADFSYDPASFLVERCRTLKDAPSKTVICTCDLDSLHAEVIKQPDGQVFYVTPPPATDPPFQELTMVPDVQTERRTVKTRVTEAPTTPTPMTTVIYQEDLIVAVELSEIGRYVDKQWCYYKELASNIRAISSNVREDSSMSRVQEILDSLRLTIQIHALSTNESVPTREKRIDLGVQMVSAVVDLIEEVAKKVPEFRKDEEASINSLYLLEDCLKHIGTFMATGYSVDYESDNMKVKLTKLPDDPADYGSMDLVNKVLDHTGATRYTIQSGSITQDSLQSLPPKSVVISMFANEEISVPGSKILQRQSFQSDGLYQDQLMHNKRNADIFLASANGPDGVSIPIKTSFGLNVKQPYPDTDTKGVYENTARHVCKYFDTRSNLWSSQGVSNQQVFQYRVVCDSDHTTAFSVVTEFTTEKSDTDSPNDYHYLAWILMIPCSLLVSLMFFALLYIHDIHPQPEQNARRMLVLFTFQLFICAHLAGVNRTDNKVACSLSQVFMQLGMLSTVGSLFNELLILFKDVTPSLWRAEYFIVIYALNTLVIPVAISGGSYLATMDEVGDNYACFVRFDSFVAIGLVYTPLVVYFLVGQIGLSLLIYRNGNSLARRMEEYDLPDELRDVISQTRQLCFVFPPLFSVTCVIMGQESPFLQVLLGLLVLFESLVLFMLIVWVPPENMDAWMEVKNPLKLDFIVKKKKKARKQPPPVNEQKYRATPDMQRPPSVMSDDSWGKTKTTQWLDSSQQTLYAGVAADEGGGRESAMSAFSFSEDLTPSPPVSAQKSQATTGRGRQSSKI